MVVCACLVISSPAAAQVIGDSFNRADSSSLGQSEVGARAYGEWSTPGSGPFPDDVASISGNRLHVHGGSATDPGVVVMRDAAFDLELRAEVRFAADDYVVDQRSNCALVVVRSALAEAGAPGGLPGTVMLNLLGSGRLLARAFNASGNTAVFDGPIATAAMAAADTDGDGVLESNEPFVLTVAAAGTALRVELDGILATEATLPDDTVTGIDAQAARGVWIGRNRFFGVPEELEVIYDDLAVFEDLCPADPDKLDPGACGCGVVETPGCGDAGPVDAAVDAPIAVDAAVDSPPTADASPPGVDDEGGGCCQGSRDTGPAAGLMTLIVMLALSARSPHSRRNRRR